MRFAQYISKCSSAIALTALLVTVPLTAKNGRDFAGQYILRAVDGDPVHVMLVLQVVNFSGSDLRQAVFALHGSSPDAPLIGDIGTVENWRDGGGVVVSREVTDTREDF